MSKSYGATLDLNPGPSTFEWYPDSDVALSNGQTLPCVTLRTTRNGFTLIGLKDGTTRKVQPSQLREH